MAPEQGPDSKSQREKMETVANDEESTRSNESGKCDKPSTSRNLSQRSVGWIYLLRKEQLIEQCKNVGIATGGFTVEHLRKQLAENLRFKRLRASAENILLELEKEVTTAERSIVLDDEVSITVPATSSHKPASDIDIMNIIHRWDLTFSGETDLMEFLERIEELAECYQVPRDRLLPSMLSVLRGNALKWYRVKREEIRTWRDFREEIGKFFLPSQYLAQLAQTFYNRRQNNRERAKDYILNMLTLARRHPILGKSNNLDRIYDGLRTEYKYYVRRTDFDSLEKLVVMTDEYEALRKEDRPSTSYMITNIAYERTKRCWRCKGVGHKRMTCHRPRRLFCSYCGRDGTFSRNCVCHNPDSLCTVNVPPSNDGRYYLTVGVYNRQVRALVDTGSSRTYIGGSLKAYLEDKKISPTSINGIVQMAGQSIATSPEVFHIPINYRSFEIGIHASVIPSLAEPMVLGMDFLRAVNIEVRLDNEILTAPASITPLRCSSNRTLTTRGFLSEDENRRLENQNLFHQRKFDSVRGLNTVAKHENRLRHTNLNKQRTANTEKKKPNQKKRRKKERKHTIPASTRSSSRSRKQHPVASPDSQRSTNTTRITRTKLPSTEMGSDKPDYDHPGIRRMSYGDRPTITLTTALPSVSKPSETTGPNTTGTERTRSSNDRSIASPKWGGNVTWLSW